MSALRCSLFEISHCPTYCRKSAEGECLLKSVATHVKSITVRHNVVSVLRVEISHVRGLRGVSGEISHSSTKRCKCAEGEISRRRNFLLMR